MREGLWRVSLVNNGTVAQGSPRLCAGLELGHLRIRPDRFGVPAHLAQNAA
jgi:hypothetical protein